MRVARLLLSCCLLPALTAGCTGFWETVTSRDFKVADLYTSPSPLVVLKNSDDGTARAGALTSLREPSQHGGSAQDQKVFLEILSKSATGDRDPLCRIAAIKSLGTFKDPQAAEVLRSVTEQPLHYEAYWSNLIRQEALKALAETGQPVAVRRLIEVAKEPPVTGAEQDVQEALDRRLTAIRGLGKYNYPESNEALVAILQADRNVAVRKRAHESLRMATGKDLPPRAEMWADYLHPENRRPGEAVAREEQPNRFWDYVTWPIRLVSGQP
jgi:HEAT repeat protein